MCKEDFIRALNEVGMEAFNEHGVVTIVSDLEDVDKMHEKLIRLARKHEYCGSLGVRLKHE